MFSNIDFLLPVWSKKGKQNKTKKLSDILSALVFVADNVLPISPFFVYN